MQARAHQQWIVIVRQEELRLAPPHLGKNHVLRRNACRLLDNCLDLGQLQFNLKRSNAKGRPNKLQPTSSVFFVSDTVSLVVLPRKSEFCSSSFVSLLK